MAILMPFLPRIYSVAPQATMAELGEQFDRCAAMGFDHVLLPQTFAAQTLAAGQAPIASAGLADLAKICRQKKLSLLLDLDIAGVTADSALTQTHPAWFSNWHQDDDLPDPRKSVRPPARQRFCYDKTDIAEEILAHWQQCLQSWHAAGVAGFRCMDVAGAPAPVWAKLIGFAKAHAPELRFLAWTPGCTVPQLQALAGCGFDATFSSSAWWDYRSRWLAEEQGFLNRIAAPIGCPDSPDEPVIARTTGSEDAAVRRRIYLRALRLAGATANGLLMPMGYETGMSHFPGSAGSQPVFDLSKEVAKVNAFIATRGAAWYGAPLQFLSGMQSGAVMLLRAAASDSASAGNNRFLIVANENPTQPCTVSQKHLLQRLHGATLDQPVWPDDMDHASAIDPASAHGLVLSGAQLQVYALRQAAPICMPPPRGKQGAVAAARGARIAIEAISPAVDGGKFPVKRTIGDMVNVEADVFIDGHDKLAVLLLWRTADQAEWQEVRMQALGNDRWSAPLPLTRIGRYLFAIEAWRDAYASYRDELEKKAGAGLNVSLELEEGRLLVQAAAASAQERGLGIAAPLKALLKALAPGPKRDLARAATRDAERIAVLLSEPTAEAMRVADHRPFAVRSEALRLDVERTAAQFSSWYELFPRSQSGAATRHGTFDDVIKRLPAIAAMGFDTLYFPPIHPIGSKFRKGRNNSLTPGPDDPGSPYAIGSADGGHDAIHPQLGSFDDFQRLRDAAAGHRLELALDFAIQCSPDHPWLADHPEWFAWRPDGSIRYAENPPKKYQDIVNVDFYATDAIPVLWLALRDVVLFWVKQGVRAFRVDNPHTKPLPFWEWLISDIRGRYPDTLFLSEAFTRPKMMYRLAKVGYSQSYTYFTWRHTKEEFIDYLTELTTTGVRDYFRPHFFVNTPDINPYFLQRSGRAGFLIRAALATTLSGLWGMYSGFELCEGTPVPGKEEYLDSEKYEIRAWDWQRPGNIVGEITLLNRLRIDNPALQSHLGIRFLTASSEHILYFMKSTEPADSHHRCGDNVILVAINLDPFAAHETSIEVPLWQLGLGDDGQLAVEDLIGGARQTWTGKTRSLRLDPLTCPYAIWRVRPEGA